MKKGKLGGCGGEEREGGREGRREGEKEKRRKAEHYKGLRLRC